MPRRNYPKNPTKTPYLAAKTLCIASTPHLACRQKRRFSTEKQIIFEIETRQLQQPDLLLDYYNCQQCKGWHLTSAIAKNN